MWYLPILSRSGSWWLGLVYNNLANTTTFLSSWKTYKNNENTSTSLNPMIHEFQTSRQGIPEICIFSKKDSLHNLLHNFIVRTIYKMYHIYLYSKVILISCIFWNNHCPRLPTDTKADLSSFQLPPQRGTINNITKSITMGLVYDNTKMFTWCFFLTSCQSRSNNIPASSPCCVAHRLALSRWWPSLDSNSLFPSTWWLSSCR